MYHYDRLHHSLAKAAFAVALAVFLAPILGAETPERHTHVTIEGEQFHINGTPTYEGRTWVGPGGEEYPIEGLLMNARLVQGVFDDVNPDTQHRWVYPDTGEWDPDRNTQGYVAAMASWRAHGLLGFTINMQGGSPEGYSTVQPWINSAFRDDGSLRPAYMDRLEQVLDRADELGMVVILGYFYFGQDGNLEDEDAVIRAVDNATEWVLDKGYRNVIVEINNECNVRYDHPILQPERVHELIERVRGIERDGRSLYASTSYGGGTVPDSNVIGASDFVLLHGNGVSHPDRIVEMCEEVRADDAYSPMPIVNNEDDRPWRQDQFRFEDEWNNFTASVSEYASWGYFDFRLDHELDDFDQGYQTVPANWFIVSDRKREFFDLVAEMTGYPGAPKLVLEAPSPIETMAGQPVEVSAVVEAEDHHPAVERIAILVNNEIVAEGDSTPFHAELDDLEEGAMIRARAWLDDADGTIIESPHVEPLTETHAQETVGIRTEDYLEALGISGEPYAQADGLVSIKAAHFHTIAPGDDHEWIVRTHPDTADYVVEAIPREQEILGPGPQSPRLDYHVHFEEAGPHYVWVRGNADSGDEDSVHVGLNGDAPSATQHLYPFEPFGQWVWTNENRDGEVAIIDVPEPGLHVINIWMREDGFLLDRLVLTPDSDFAPEGEGPRPSGRYATE